MGQEAVRVPVEVELTRLARDVLGGASELGEAWWEAQRHMRMGAFSFGGTPAAIEMSSDHDRLVDEAGATIERQVEVLELEVDSAYRAAAAQRRQEQANPRRGR